MECQIEQMKSSIANIQQSLRRLEHDNTAKVCHQMLLPQSVIHEHPLAKESPTPKVTASVPNITRTQKFTPARHHLDDTEMKNALKYSESLSNTKKCKLKQKSNTAKVKYIFDGARVAYVAPTKKESYNQYGHFVIECDRNHRKQSQSISQNSMLEYYMKTGQENRAQTQRNHHNKTRINKYNKVEIQQKQRKIKHSESKDHFSDYIPLDVDKRTERVKKSKHVKSKGTYCKINKNKIKQSFSINWNPNTDSEFSEMEL